MSNQTYADISVIRRKTREIEATYFQIQGTTGWHDWGVQDSIRDIWRRSHSMNIHASANTNTKRKSKKLQKSRNRLDIWKNYFISKVIDNWNGLPEVVISAKIVNSFETRLDSHLSAHPMRCDYTTLYNCYIGISKGANSISEPNIY